MISIPRSRVFAGHGGGREPGGLHWLSSLQRRPGKLARAGERWALGIVGRAPGRRPVAPNTAWSPLHELPDVPLSDPDVPLFRWSHSKIKAALKLAESEGLISAAVRRDTDATAAGLYSGSADPALNAWFAAVAKRKDMAGWNAAILWAHYDPGAAREAVDVLSQLVLHPPRYTPDEELTVRSQSPKEATAAKSVPRPAPSKDRPPRSPVEISPNMRSGRRRSLVPRVGRRAGRSRTGAGACRGTPSSPESCR